MPDVWDRDSIRWATETDVALLTGYLREMARECPVMGPLREDVVPWLQTVLAQPNTACLVGEDVGFFLGSLGEHGWTGRPTLWEWALWIHPRARGKDWWSVGMQKIWERFGPVDIRATVLSRSRARWLRQKGFQYHGLVMVRFGHLS